MLRQPRQAVLDTGWRSALLRLRTVHKVSSAVLLGIQHKCHAMASEESQKSNAVASLG